MGSQEQIARAWNDLMEGRPFNTGHEVREVIAESWRRSFERLGRTDIPCQPSCSADEIAALLASNDELCRTAFPLMEEYTDFFNKEHGVLFLVAHDGRMLRCVGDGDLMRKRGMKPGTDFREELRGTNATGFCLRNGAYAEVVGAEHFHSESWDTACCAEPLWGGKQRLLGVLGMVMPLSSWNRGAVMFLHSVASNINSQHHVNDLLNDQETMLGLMTDGVIILNRDGYIKAVNAAAKRMLGISSKDSVAVGSLSDFISDADYFMQIMKQHRRITDEEVALHIGGEQKRFVLSVAFIPEGKGILCNFASAERMQKFAVRAAGYKAIYRFDDILGESERLVNAVQLAKVASQSDITTLLLGESGTGKELFAHAIHNGSSRRNAPFVAVNCGALPRDLVQSELFGYEAGAFTGAARNGKPGKFELADGGTIFLDEIGEMPMEAQTNLLRLIQNREVGRVGGTTMKALDVRIVAATNRRLSEAVEHGTFRSDLYYRLCVLAINIPSLKEREGDIALLARHFLGKYAANLDRAPLAFAPDALDVLQSYAWPGNIRELENVMEYVANTVKGGVVHASDFPSFMDAGKKGGGAPAVMAHPLPPVEPRGVEGTLDDMQRRKIIDTITRCNGNIMYAAEVLGISRSSLYAKMSRFGIDQSKYRPRGRKA